MPAAAAKPMRCFRVAIGAAVVAGLWPVIVLAQQAGTGAIVSDAPFQAVISGPTDVPVGRTVVLNAGLSRTDGERVRYAWYLGDSRTAISRSVEIVATPDQPGMLEYRLVLESADGRRRSEVRHTVMAYRRKIVLVAGPSIAADRIDTHRKNAEEAGLFLRTIAVGDVSGRLGGEDAIVQLFAEQRSAFVGAEAVVLWGDGITSLQALQRAAQSDPDMLAALRNQTILLLTDRGINTLARTARGPFSVIRPLQILVTRPEALPPLLTGLAPDALLGELLQRDIDVALVNAETARLMPWNALSTLVNAMRVRGVGSEVIVILLMLPFIATILAFLKQVVGITTFGLYTPAVVAISFLALGWAIGLVSLACILAVSYGTRRLMRRWRLLHIPKMAIILTMVSFVLLLLLGVATFAGVPFSRDTVLILLVLSTLSESFLTLKAEEGWYAATLGTLETILAALLCVALVQWAAFQSVILAYPELVLLTFVANVALGRWTGLRLTEYFRFREVFRHLQEE
ncbi:MAG: transglutaminase [Candidatus Peregrinibacteria bacterium Gr01-1014_25]|nr:MAG: transglutaminase [Candidatus Peregrinibacteria bacterium Gr01-1014_25]